MVNNEVSLKCEAVFYYESEEDFGWKQVYMPSDPLETLNNNLFSFLENQAENFKNTDLIGLTLVLSLFSVFVFSKPCNAGEFLKTKMKSQLREEMSNSFPSSLSLKEVVPLLPIKNLKGRRLGRYCESFNGQLLIHIFEAEPTKNVFISPLVLPSVLMKSPDQISRFARSYPLNLLTKEVIFSRPYTVPTVPVRVFASLTNLLRLNTVLGIIPWWLPVPPGGNFLLGVVKEGIKFLSGRKKSGLQESESESDFDFISKILSGLGNKVPSLSPKVFPKSPSVLTFMPGTIFLLILALFQRKNLDHAVGNILETAGIIQKKSLLQKISGTVGSWVNPQRPTLYVLLLSGGVCYLFFINREKIITKISEANPIVLSFQYLNTFFNEYKRLVETSVVSAQKLSNDAYARMWGYAERETAELSLLKRTLENSRNENKVLTDEIYQVAKQSDRNEASGSQCQKDLSLRQVEIVRQNKFIASQKISYQTGNSLGSLESSMQPLLIDSVLLDREDKSLYKDLLQANAINYPVEKASKRIVNGEVDINQLPPLNIIISLETVKKSKALAKPSPSSSSSPTLSLQNIPEQPFIKIVQDFFYLSNGEIPFF